MKFNVNIDKCLVVLRKNLEEHKVELKDANEVWTKDTLAALEELRDAINRDGLKASEDKLKALFYQRPQDNRAQYSRYIGSLQVAQESGETHISLDEDDYDKMFNDNWDWRIMSKAANATYSSRRM